MLYDFFSPETDGYWSLRKWDIFSTHATTTKSSNENSFSRWWDKSMAFHVISPEDTSNVSSTTAQPTTVRNWMTIFNIYYCHSRGNKPSKFHIYIYILKNTDTKNSFDTVALTWIMLCRRMFTLIGIDKFG